jgi:hypothetical protein
VDKKLSESDNDLIKSIKEIENGTAKLYSMQEIIKDSNLLDWYNNNYKNIFGEIK